MQVTRLANGIRGRIAILGRCYMVADMNEPTYTAEKIREAMAVVCFTSTKTLPLYDALMAELQRPAYVPEVGEVYAYKKTSPHNIEWEYIGRKKGGALLSDNIRRPLTRTECGPVGRTLGVAVDVLERVNNGIVNQHRIDETLSEIKRLEQNDE